MKNIKIGLLAFVAVLLVLGATGCTGVSIDSAKYANGKHRSLTWMWPGNPYVDGNARLVQNQSQAQTFIVQNGNLVPVASDQLQGLTNGQFVVRQSQPQTQGLPLAPVFGINSGSPQPQPSYNGYYESGYGGGCGVYYEPHYNVSGGGYNYGYGEGYYQPHYNTSSGGANYSYGGCVTPRR